MSKDELFDELGLTSLAKRERGEDVKLPSPTIASPFQSFIKKYDSHYIKFTTGRRMTTSCCRVVPWKNKNA